MSSELCPRTDQSGRSMLPPQHAPHLQAAVAESITMWIVTVHSRLVHCYSLTNTAQLLVNIHHSMVIHINITPIWTAIENNSVMCSLCCTPVHSMCHHPTITHEINIGVSFGRSKRRELVPISDK